MKVLEGPQNAPARIGAEEDAMHGDKYGAVQGNAYFSFDPLEKKVQVLSNYPDFAFLKLD